MGKAFTFILLFSQKSLDDAANTEIMRQSSINLETFLLCKKVTL